MNKGRFVDEEPYPNRIGFKRYTQAHFDPVEGDYQEFDNAYQEGVKSYAKGPLDVREVMIPRACDRQKKAFARCKLVNGSEKCAEEVKGVMEICPTWALERKRSIKHSLELIRLVFLKKSKF